MRFGVLGPLEVIGRDGPIEVPGRAERTLLAILLARTGRTVPMEDLIEGLWSFDPPPTARKSLQAHVARLRRALEPPASTNGDDRSADGYGRAASLGAGHPLQTRGTGYLLAIDADAFDATVFDRSAAAARRHLAQGSYRRASEILETALGLWRGPAYVGFADVQVVAAEAARLEELRSSAVEDGIDAALLEGRHREVIADLEAIVRRDPLRERPWSQLMLALYRSGRQADALAAFQRARSALVTELGAEPGAELQRLQADILAQDPALEAPGIGRAWFEAETVMRIGEAATRTAGRRADLRSVESDLVDNVIDLQVLRGSGGAAGAQPPAGLPVCPYKGLAPFEAADAEYFCGRERLVAELVAGLAGGNFVAVVGASGSGKSSAVRAGLIPAVAGGILPGSKTWRTGVMRPGAHPLEELEALMPANGPEASEGRTLLVVDQFEETFTVCRDEAERKAFIQRLTGEAERADGSVAVVVAIRSDLYGACAAYPTLAAVVGANHVLVGPMADDDLRRVIELPAERAGLDLDDGLADALVADVSGEPGALPLLSTTLLELWLRGGGRALRLSDFKEAGGVRGSVARQAESTYAALSDDQAATARRILLRLAASGEGDAVVARRVPRAELDGLGDDVDATVRALVDARLLTTGPDGIEVAHEALFREWPRLRDWLADGAEERRLHDHLGHAARDWEERGHDAGDLYRGARLAAVLDWSTRPDAGLNDVERRFLDASRNANERAAEQQRRSNRRLRGLLAGVAVLLVLALVAGSVALAQRTHARVAATVSLAQRLGAQGVSQPQFSRALLLAREGVNLVPSDSTRGSLLAALLRAPGVMRAYTTAETERPLSIGLVNEGRTLAIAANTMRVHFFDVATGTTLGSSLPTNRVIGSFIDCCAPGPAGEAIAAFDEPNNSVGIVAVDPRTGRTLRSFSPSFPGYMQYTASPDGTTAYVATTFTDANGGVPPDAPTWIYRWNAATGASLGRTSLGPGVVDAIDVIDAGTKISVLTTTGEVLVDAASMQVERRAAVSLPIVPTAATNADGTIAAFVAADQRSVSFVDLSTGTTVSGVGNPLTALQGLAFSPTDPGLAITTGDDGTAVLWDARTGRAKQVLKLHASRVTAVRFAPDGASFYTASLDGTVIRSSLSGRGGFGSSFDVAAPGTDPVANPIGNPTPPVAAGRMRSAFAQGGRKVAMVENATGTSVSFDAAPAGFTVVSLAMSPDGRTLVVGSNGVTDPQSGDVRLYDVSGTPTLSRVLPLDVKYPGVNIVAFSPDGARVLAATGNTDPKTRTTTGGSVVAWDAGTGAFAFPPIVIEGYRVWYLAIDRSGALAALGLFSEKDQQVRVIRLPSGAIVGSRSVPVGIDAVAFGSDGTVLLGDYAGRVLRLSVASMRPIGRPVLTGGGPLASVVAAPDAPTYVTTNFDGSTRLWGLASGQQIGSSFTPLAAMWNGASISPDGRTLAILGPDAGAWLYPLSGSTWARQACRAAGRNLTRTEWSEFVGDLPYAKVCPQFPLGPS